MVSGGLASVGYFASWSIYTSHFNIWQIDPVGLTHINYAFMNINDNGTVILGDPWADVEKINEHNGDNSNDPKNYLHGNLYQLFRLKSENRWLKTGMSIGGWTWSGLFSKVSATETSRKLFVSSAIKMLLAYGLDFVDLDWEFPVKGGLPSNKYNPEDGHNFVLLLKEFKRQFAMYPAYNFEVSAAIGCTFDTLLNYKIADMDQYLDRYNMMCYDFTGSWSSEADHQSNLFPRDSLVPSVSKSIQYVISSGATPRKLIIGIPVYGRAFSHTTGGLTTHFTGTGPGTWEPGIYDYKTLPLIGCQPQWEPASNASFCYNNNSHFLISYDTPTSLSYKLKWILQMGLGGAMMWELSADYSTNSDKSLQNMIKIWLGPYLDMTANNLCYPMSPFGNIKNSHGCDSKSLNNEQSLEIPINDVYQHTLLKHDPLVKGINIKILEFARAHYNYTAFNNEFHAHYKSYNIIETAMKEEAKEKERGEMAYDDSTTTPSSPSSSSQDK